MSSHMPIRIYIVASILGVNTLYRRFCFFKLFPVVGKGLNCIATARYSCWYFAYPLNATLRSSCSLPSTPAEPDPEPKDVVVAVTRPIPLEVVSTCNF